MIHLFLCDCAIRIVRAHAWLVPTSQGCGVKATVGNRVSLGVHMHVSPSHCSARNSSRTGHDIPHCVQFTSKHTQTTPLLPATAIDACVLFAVSSVDNKCVVVRLTLTTGLRSTHAGHPLPPPSNLPLCSRDCWVVSPSQKI